MQITNVTTHEQTSDDLSPERIGRITGSAVGAILGLSKWQKPADVLRSMVRAVHGAPSEFTGSIATDWGNTNEGVALLSYAAKTNTTPINAPFYAGDLDAIKIGASPDAIVSENGYLLEVKCPFGKRDQIPNAAEHLAEHPDYEAQMQWQMLCTDTPVTHFVVWTKHGSDFVSVPRNEFWLLANYGDIEAFWFELQTVLATPELYEPMLTDLDGGYVIREDDAFLDAADDYAALSAQIKKLEERQDAIKKQLLTLAGKQKCKGGDVTIFSTEKKGAVDYAKVPQLVGVDLEPYRKKGSTSWTVKVSGGE